MQGSGGLLRNLGRAGRPAGPGIGAVARNRSEISLPVSVRSASRATPPLVVSCWLTWACWKELPLQRMAQQVRVMRVYGGPSEMHRMAIARRVLKELASSPCVPRMPA